MIFTCKISRRPALASLCATAATAFTICFTAPARAQERFPEQGNLSCSSNNGRRVYCDADTRYGVRMVRRTGDAECRQGSGWGYDSRGVWVDHGCRAEFDLSDKAATYRERPEAMKTIAAGTRISVRTNEYIDARTSDGRAFSGVVNEDVTDEGGRVAIPRGSYAELAVRTAADRDLILDLESVDVNGLRYAVRADPNRTEAGNREGVGANRRTGEYVGGGAVLGAIIGAIAGGGKGAAIGAAAGAGAGTGTQLLTRGRNLRIPVESVVTFRLERPLEVGVADNGYDHNGVHYHR